MAQINNIAFIM